MSSLQILFVLRHSGYVRNFETVVDQLAQRGHRVHLAFELPRESAELAEALAARHSGVTWGRAPKRTDAWASLTRDLRYGRDALRYRSALYRDAPKLTARGLRRAPATLRRLTTPTVMRRPRMLGALHRVLRRLDAAIPPDPGIEAFVEGQSPDLLLVTPLVDGPSQEDFVRAARRRGVPSALCVASWDNLTNKGLIKAPLEHVFVWNEPQRREAIDLHGMSPDRVTATGAHSYDHWFAWRTSSNREAFCEQVGLPGDRPYVLYLCSSKFIAPTEPGFVRRWLTELRAATGPLRDCGVLVRPHPASGGWWSEVDIDDLGPVAVWPPTGADPRGAAAKADYFDSMYHCAAAVGINTSAIVELSIIGRPAFTILDPEFADTQQGTIHFAHLTSAGGGALTAAPDFAQHTAQLAAAVAGAKDLGRRREDFLREFIRPNGLERPAAPRMVEAFERLAAETPLALPARDRVDALLRFVMQPLVTRARTRPKPRKAAKRRPMRHRLRRTHAAKLVRCQHKRLREFARQGS